MKKYLDWLFIAYLASILTMLAVFTACSVTKQIEHTADIQRTTDTLRIYQQRVDSVYFRDSVYYKEYIKGDTVFLLQYKERIRWKVKKGIDTIYVSKTDTIVKTEYKEKVVEKESIWDYVRAISWILIILAFLFVIYRIKK